MVMSFLMEAWAVGRNLSPVGGPTLCSVPVWPGDHGDVIHAISCINIAMLYWCLRKVPDPADVVHRLPMKCPQRLLPQHKPPLT